MNNLNSNNNSFNSNTNKKDDKSRNSLNLTPMIATFAVSAIWHGFYSGYFVFFTSVALLDI